MHSLSDYKGKVVVVDVWATWCGPCVKEMPFFKKLKDEFEGKEVVFMGVSVDENKFKWEAYMKKQGLTGVQLWGKVIRLREFLVLCYSIKREKSSRSRLHVLLIRY